MNLRDFGKVCRGNSERWFAESHSEMQLVPMCVHYGLAMCGEAGEVANVVKKWLRFPSSATDGALAEAVELELADVLIYLLLMADDLGIDMEEAVARKVAINEERFG